MSRKLRLLLLAVVPLAAGSLLAGCESEEPAEPVGEPSPLGLQLGALTSSCAGDGAPLSTASRYTVCGASSVNLTTGGSALREFFESSPSLDGTTLTVGSIPSRGDYEITVVGRNDENEPLYLARTREIAIVTGDTTNVDMTLVPYNDSACLSLEDVNNPPHTVFPASIALPDGRVFVSGGFQIASGTGDDRVFEAPSNITYFVDPTDGSITAGPQLMRPRGAHRMAFIDNGTRSAILVVGGSESLTWSAASSSLSLGFEATTGVNDVEIIDITSGTATMDPTPIPLEQQRVFPVLTTTVTNNLIITGGGDWPDPGNDYIEVDYIKSASDGSFVESSNDFFARMLTERTGHSVTYVGRDETASTPSDVYLVYGGTTGDDRAELLLVPLSGDSEPTFRDDNFDTSGANPERTFFHSATGVGGNSVIALGGATYDSGSGLSSISAGATYKLNYIIQNDSEVITVEKLPSMPTGRIFHSATSHDGRTVSILGGFTGINGGAISDVLCLDGIGGTFDEGQQPRTPLVARAGHAAAMTLGDAIYMAGGIEVVDDLISNEPMLSEIFVPGCVSFCAADSYAASEDADAQE